MSTRKRFIEEARRDDSKVGMLDFILRPLKTPVLLILGLLFYVGCCLLLMYPRMPALREGVLSRDDIIALVDFTWNDTEASQKAKELERKNEPPVFQLNNEVKSLKRTEDFKNDLRLLMEALFTVPTIKEVDSVILSRWQEADESLISPAEYTYLNEKLKAYSGQHESQETIINDHFYPVINELMEMWWIDSATDQNLRSLILLSDKVVVRGGEGDQLVNRRDLVVFDPQDTEVKNAEQVVMKTLKDRLRNVFDEDDSLSFDIFKKLFLFKTLPNISLDVQTTQLNREAAVAGVPDVIHTVKANDVLVRAGTIPKARDVERLEAYRKELQSQKIWMQSQPLSVVGRLVLFTLVYLIFLVVLTEGNTVITRNKGRFFSFAVLSLFVLAAPLWLGQLEISPLWIPLIFVVEIVQVAYNRRDAILVTLFLGVTLALLLNSGGVALTLTLGALTAIFCSKSIKSRLTLIVSGLIAGVMMWLADASYVLQRSADLMSVQESLAPSFADTWVAFGNGFFTGVLITGILPVIEKLFHITTPITWLELGNMNHPALKHISMDAPGTWQHSLMLSALSEAGTNAIGGDGLMARVVCYYHDLGKSLKPQYYIENQINMSNPHDSLTPAMSALIIHSHPKDGAEMARQYNLPDQVIDAILQHHGTTRVEYFYRMAVKNAENPEDVREENFRYPGPKPQYREMGVIMLADSAESATRSLKNPTPGKIRSMIENVVKHKVDQGQLDESGLSLTEISTVIDVFTHVITNIHHHRIEYPADPKEDENKNQKQEKNPVTAE